MKHIISAMAAVALLAAGANAQPGNDKNNRGKPEQGPSQGSSMKGGDKQKGPSREGGPAAQAMRSDKGPPHKAAVNAEQGPPMKASHPEAKPVKVVKGPPEKPGKELNDHKQDNSGVRVLADGRHVYDHPEALHNWTTYDRHGLIAGCPPGLAKKHNGCTPPGLAKAKEPRYRYTTFRPDWWGLGGLALGGGRYLYSDGYLLRLDGDRIGGYIPLLGGALAIGNPWPSYYTPRPAPDYYVSYYDLGPANGYRYADDVFYRVDPTTAAITSIAALLTGDDIQVGQPMPRGYDVYNVPYPYRSQYVDGPSARYRYSDGYVYQIDPETQLVAAAIELLVS
ncbi:hypothetical protein GRI89_00650 [Altererythrobacter salegens]|uniref:Uncharacterized protein n=1 Tax=Croceibacterium salegens TaxID=1737568 RepID=A0A6I4SQG0_9SPHN|nr:hypothetical protein [Croceibacterium salegens]MXO58054.1 hypothetical protein [Croceibacterium salegens]